ncbi:MAG: ABC transporter permease [Candidatus Bathyarchaeia archaeon]
MQVPSFFRHVLVMMELELRRLRHDRMELYSRAIQPVLWIVVFAPIMSGIRAIPTGNIPYTDYIVPGVLIQSTTMIAIFFGLTLIFERESGILKKLLVTPTSRYTIVIGRSLSAGVRALFQILIIVPFALLLGVSFVPNPLFFFLAVLIMFFASAGFAALSIFIASFLKARERFQAIGQAITFPLFFASNSLYPISLMPPVLQEFSRFNPMTYIVDAVRGFLISGDLTNLPLDLLAISLFVGLMFFLASKSFNRIIQ